MKHEVFMIYLQSSRSFLKNTSKKPLEILGGNSIRSRVKTYCIHWVLCHFCVSSSSTSEKPFSAGYRRMRRYWAGTFLLCQWDLWWTLFKSRGAGRGPGVAFWKLIASEGLPRLIRPIFDRFYLVIQTEQQQWGVYIHFDSTTMSQHETSWSQAPKWSPNILIDTNGSAFETFLSSIFGNFQKGSWTRNRIEMKLHLVSYVRNSLKKTHYVEPIFFCVDRKNRVNIYM